MGISATAEINLQNFILLQKAVDDSIDEGLENAGKLIVSLASQLAPEDTGLLKDSGESSVTNGALEVSFGNGLPDNRAIAQEFGTVYMPAHPYLTVALREIDIPLERAKVIRGKLI